MRSKQVSVYGKEIDSWEIARELALDKGFQCSAVVEKLRKEVDNSEPLVPAAQSKFFASLVAIGAHFLP